MRRNGPTLARCLFQVSVPEMLHDQRHPSRCNLETVDTLLGTYRQSPTEELAGLRNVKPSDTGAFLLLTRLPRRKNSNGVGLKPTPDRKFQEDAAKGGKEPGQ